MLTIKYLNPSTNSDIYLHSKNKQIYCICKLLKILVFLIKYLKYKIMIYNGTLQILKMDGTQLAELTNVTASLTQETFDVTSKESAGWTEILPGVRSATFTAEGIADFQATNKDLADVFTAYTNRASVAIEWTNAVSGDKKLTCTAYITSCEISAPMEDTVTYSIEFASTGAVTSATI